MSLKLDDLLLKKKEAVQILDLSKSTANTKEELRKLLERVPEFKIKIEKVKSEDVKVHDRRFAFKTPKKELKERSFPFTNPIPIEMKSVCLDDLCTIPIQWKMLTSLRPKSRLDEEYYSKLVELGKCQMASREKEKAAPLVSFMRKTKNRAGVLETTIVCCRTCGEEFCSTETCRQVAYDLYERENITKLNDSTEAANAAGEPYERRRRIKKRVVKSKIRLTKKKGNKVAAAKGTTSNKITEVKVKLETKKPKKQRSNVVVPSSYATSGSEIIKKPTPRQKIAKKKTTKRKFSTSVINTKK